VGEAGLIVPEADVPALAAAIATLAADPGLARQMGTLGKRQVCDKYTWQKVAEAMYTLYLAVGQSPRQGAPC
jgi:glycosyltransferase involved in cell wall biosynthesis